ncbi:ATP-binding protein [Fibrobacterota bacterium]
MIQRKILRKIQERIDDPKIHIILGPRQSGKTTLANEMVRRSKLKTIWLNGDEMDVRERLREPTSTRLKALIGDAELVVIDEAQRIENIGICLKLLIDKYPELKIVATGSSSFDLSNKINEPLTGRKWEYKLLPISYEEQVSHIGALEEHRLLQHRLTYGWYPEVITSPGREQELLKLLVDSYLYRDILTWERIKKPEKLEKLVMALALQVSSEVSYNELSRLVGVNNETIENYISLLEKSFVIFRLNAFSRNIRNELKKSRKIYFYDIGVRNALINNFNDPAIRDDCGKLWENFCIVERIKRNDLHNYYANMYFWRTTQQQEIDYIEEYDGKLHAYEFKWNEGKKSRFSKTFLNAYNVGSQKIIHPNNVDEFIK